MRGWGGDKRGQGAHVLKGGLTRNVMECYIIYGHHRSLSNIEAGPPN